MKRESRTYLVEQEATAPRTSHTIHTEQNSDEATTHAPDIPQLPPTPIDGNKAGEPWPALSRNQYRDTPARPAPHTIHCTHTRAGAPP